MRWPQAGANTRAPAPQLSALPRPTRRWLPWTWPVFLPWAIHLALSLHYLPLGELFGNAPIANTDHALRFGLAAGTADLLGQTGRAWGYDPFFLAGYPAGTLYDLNYKGVELATALLAPWLGVPLAYNLIVAALYLLFPLPICLAVRLLGLSPRGRALAVALGLLLWYSDPALRWAWLGGTYTFALGSALAVLAVAALHRYLHSGQRAALLTLAVAAPLTPLLAGQAALALLIAAAPVYALALSRLPWRRHLALALVAGLVVAVNLYWLAPLVRFAPDKTSSDSFLQAGLGTLLADLLGNGRTLEGWPSLAGARWLTLGLALLLWPRRRAAPYLLPFLLASGVCLLLAYLGGRWPPLADWQPYRFVIPAALLAAIPAAQWLDNALHPLSHRERESHALTPRSRRDESGAGGEGQPRVRGPLRLAGIALLALLLAFSTVRAGEAAWQFRPGGERDERLLGPSAAARTVLDWLRGDASGGRVLLDDFRLAALVPYFNGRETLGGPHGWVWLREGYANAAYRSAFGRELSSYTRPELETALRTFNVTVVVANADFAEPVEQAPATLETLAPRWPDLFQPAASVGAYRVYRLPWTAEPLLVGQGTVQAGYNRLVVRGASPGTVVLKYHWQAGLRTEPPLPLRPYTVLADPVGFIAIENGRQTNFTIVAD